MMYVVWAYNIHSSHTLSPDKILMHDFNKQFVVSLNAMRLPDLDEERSEKSFSFGEFMKSYNGDAEPVSSRIAPLLRNSERRAQRFSTATTRGRLTSIERKVMDWLTS